MFAPLPADTVFEAKARARRRTALLFALLAAIYLLFSNLIVSVLFYESGLRERGADPLFAAPPEMYAYATLGALAAAAAHFAWARSRKLETFLRDLGARDPDLRDEAHKRFAAIVEEAGIAVGRTGIRPVVLPTSAVNAFSIEAAGGETAIGATEGILARLTRPQLEAVLAHEAAHLAHGDSRLLATACSLFAVFGVLAGLLEPSRHRRSRGSGAMALVWLIAAFGHFLSKLIYMAISRNREYFADSEAVHMCKNPSALAGALQKISSADRGFMAVPDSFSAIFILNPALSALDETQSVSADLFSTHPPVRSRIEKLMAWAQQHGGEIPAAASDAPPLFTHQAGAWQGQFAPIDSAAAPAAESGEAGALHCPRCRNPLADESYEGMATLRCLRCGGRLLPAEGIQRALARRQARFGEDSILDVQKWRAMQRGTLRELCLLPHLSCPRCGKPMMKRFHTEVTRVVVDVCMNAACGSIWCDGGELEKIEILIEAAEKEFGR